MFKLKEQPYNLLLITALFLLIAGLFCFDQSLDFHLYDTYFVASLAYFIWIPVSVLSCIWLLYKLTKHLLHSKVLTWIHVLVTVLCTICILIGPYMATYIYASVAGAPRRYYDYSAFYAFKISNYMSKAVAIAFIILLAGQLTYIFNLFAGLYRLFLSRSNRHEQ